MVADTEYSCPILILFDLNYPEACKQLHDLRASFGEQYAKIAILRWPRCCILMLYPGGALERVT
jgi:hypothetical protein